MQHWLRIRAYIKRELAHLPVALSELPEDEGADSQRGRWNTVYPRYFDAKVSINDGRRVPRQAAVWWPQATHISQACRSLGLMNVLEVGCRTLGQLRNPLWRVC